MTVNERDELRHLVDRIEQAMFHGGEWGGQALLIQHAAELHDAALERDQLRVELARAADRLKSAALEHDCVTCHQAGDDAREALDAASEP